MIKSRIQVDIYIFVSSNNTILSFPNWFLIDIFNYFIIYIFFIQCAFIFNLIVWKKCNFLYSVYLKNYQYFVSMLNINSELLFVFQWIEIRVSNFDRKVRLIFSMILTCCFYQYLPINYISIQNIFIHIYYLYYIPNKDVINRFVVYCVLHSKINSL